MKIKRDERRFDLHDIGLAIKRAREASGMTQAQLAYIVDRAPRTIMYNENDGQHLIILWEKHVAPASDIFYIEAPFEVDI